MLGYTAIKEALAGKENKSHRKTRASARNTECFSINVLLLCAQVILFPIPIQGFIQKFWPGGETEQGHVTFDVNT